MRIWIDCEFNEFRGALISMALVAEDGREFYEVVPCANPGPWVAEHVMPILGKKPIRMVDLQMALMLWLKPYDRAHLIADWPEDIAHFCAALITNPGQRIPTPPLTMEIRRDLDATSAIPHNALADARAIRDMHSKVEEAASAAQRKRGMYRKFNINRVDGGDRPGGKHDGCEYFMLDTTHDQHARRALLAYADACKDTHPQLSADLVKRWA